MGKRVSLSGLVFCVTVAAGALAAIASGESTAGMGASGGGRAAQLERELGPGVDVALHRETGGVRFIGTAPGWPIARPPSLDADASPAAVARAFLDSYGDEFGLKAGSNTLRITDTVDSSGGDTVVRLQQTIGGVPVLAGELVVNVDSDSNVLSVLGEVEPDGADTSAEIGTTEARRIAIASIAKGSPVAASEMETTDPKLAIYDSRLLGGPGLDFPALVWQTEVSSAADPALRQLVLVDANIGVVAGTIDLIEEAKDRRVCDANETESDYPCEAPYDREEGGPATGNTDIDSAYDFAGDTYDFYFSRFGRDSLNGAGLPLVSTVRYCPSGEPCPYKNAFWDGSQMVYGLGFAAADDVVGHELSHGFTQFTSHLFYWYQSGAINESLSDVFGEYIDLTNAAGTDTPAVRWQLGEDIPGIGTIRDMKNPPAFNDPDKMTSALYVADPNNYPSGDNGGVHTNSGVNNKAAYLIADGDTFNGATVTGIGITKAARIYYEVETAQLTSGSDYADLYNALPQACTNSIGGAEGITAADCLEVADAVNATEMNQQPLNGPAPEAPVCGAGQSPVNLFFDDLENTASGNWAHSALSGADEWYYPQNSNPYGFDATYATSGDTNFWGYDQSTTADYVIARTADLTIPVGTTYLRFNHSYAFEDGPSNGARFDGGQLQYSTDGGTTWLNAGSLITHNGYNGTVSGGFGNPLAGQMAFTAESNGYISSRVDLSSLAGQNVRFRFRIGSDNSSDDYGWFIDDVRVYGCQAGGGPAGPSLTSTDPASGSNDNSPRIIGTAPADTDITLYQTSNCTGAVEATGSAAQLASPGLAASVPNNSTNQFSATATDAGGTSDCSNSIAYTEVTPALTPIYDNGSIVTNPGGGFGGADLSALTSPDSFLGFTGQSSSSRLADDFTIGDPGGWQIDSLRVFGYQTGSTTTSTFTSGVLRIWNGVPDLTPNDTGPIVIFGDTSTNRLNESEFSNVYRAESTSPTNTQRPIMNLDLDVGTTLPPGAYWIEYAAAGSLASGPFFPPITTTPGAVTGNARQFNIGASTWANLIDAGSGAAKGMPFKVYGTVLPPPRTLTVSTSGSGTGSVTGLGINCPGDCTETYDHGTVVSLTANPTGGSTFAWGGECSGSGACAVTMDADTSVSATFTVDTQVPQIPAPSLTPGETTAPLPDSTCEAAKAKVKRAKRKLQKAETAGAKKKAKQQLKRAMRRERAVC